MTHLSKSLSDFIDAVIHWRSDVRDKNLRIDGFVSRKGETVTIHYAPFEYINPHARLVLVGITPGDVQSKEALSIAQMELRAGKTPAAAAKAAKRAASFKGEMRDNLALQFDTFGLSKLFGMTAGSDLFGLAENNVHYTSTLRYPVSVDGLPFRGGSSLGGEPKLAAYRDTLLVEELNHIPSAVVFPLGDFARAAVKNIKKRRLIGNPVISGLYHPSKDKTDLISVFCGRAPISKLGPRYRAKDPEDAINKRRKLLQSEIDRFLAMDSPS